MINLKNDYCGICHPQILEELLRHQDELFVGYGMDEYTHQAEDRIRNLIKCSDAGVYFTITGTSTNKIMIDHALKTAEAVIACDSAHINVHETGAIESSGHKILTVPNSLGKVNIEDVENVIKQHVDFHMVKPKMIYISNSTEYGTVYTKNELLALRELCNKYGLYLFMDGARLGTALCSDLCDYEIDFLPSVCDAFYIGGNKNGLILGEALVITNKVLDEGIRYTIKTNGGLLSKGFVTGIEFNTLFEKNLFFEIAKKENEYAKILEEKLSSIGIKFLIQRESNQIFPIFDEKVVEKLEKQILFEIWEKNDNNVVIRFVTHYKTTISDIEETLEIIKKCLK